MKFTDFFFSTNLTKKPIFLKIKNTFFLKKKLKKLLTKLLTKLKYFFLKTSFFCKMILSEKSNFFKNLSTFLTFFLKKKIFFLKKFDFNLILKKKKLLKKFFLKIFNL